MTDKIANKDESNALNKMNKNRTAKTNSLI